jgi:predicted Fe-S protein YdhL (DUF1289 family)
LTVDERSEQDRLRESVSHVLKRTVQWRPSEIPVLINKIRQLFVGQYAEANRTVCGCGDFMLVPSHANNRVAVDNWKSLTDEQRQTVIDRCFRMTTSASVSKDGHLQMTRTPNAGRKPNQRKRPCSKRSSTVKKVKLLDSSFCMSNDE